jgi:excisionase family DNA binding protein
MAYIDDALKEYMRDEFHKLIAARMPTQEPEDALWGVKELAEYLGMSSDWVYRQIMAKTLPHFKLGSVTKFKKKDVDRWLYSSCYTFPETAPTRIPKLPTLY